MFDRALLPPAALEFVVIGDTHVMPDPGDRPVEFASRRQQTARAEHALRLAAALAPDFTVHLGDFVQVPLDSPSFALAVDDACAQLARCGVRPYPVAGNQDIGDKPDPTMPTGPVTRVALADYHARFGRSWYSWQAGDLHCVVVNTQIMNTTLPAAAEQARWLEADLQAHAGQRIALFLHLPPYLFEPHEPHLGHYDNFGEPARGWLLDLLRQHAVMLVCAGHCHWFFDNRLGPTRLVVAPSTSHTRPGFSETFSSCPPAEQGRDDTAKLGFLLVRLHEDGPRLHLIRTHGATTPPDPAAPRRRLLTRLPADLPDAPVGVSLWHPLSPAAAVPLAWPSVVRQPVRNDWPLLALLELGARWVRVPASDLDDPLQRQRLDVLRAEGVAVTATWLWEPDLALPAAVAARRDALDAVEVQLPGTPEPSPDCLAALAACLAGPARPVTLAPVLPGERQPGAMLPRTRTGYRPDELPALAARLAAAGLRGVRALVRVGPAEPPWAALTAASAPAELAGLDWAVESTGTDEAASAARVAEAIAAIATRPGDRLVLEPLLDLDRTMDRRLGLLDRASNPRPAHQVARCLISLLFAAPEPRQPEPPLDHPAARLLALHGPTSSAWLLLPQAPGAPLTLRLTAAGPVRAYQLSQATSELLLDRAAGTAVTLTPAGPLLLVAPAGSRTALD